MKYVKLGRTGLKVSRLCLGTNMFGAGYVDDERADKVINTALDAGVNFIDTADIYHLGRSEVVVGSAISHRREEVVLATKGGYPMGERPNQGGLSRGHLVDAVDASLRRLDTDYIDLYQVHVWDPETPLEETMRALDDLVTAGKIRYVGCSNFTGWQLVKSLWASDRSGHVRFDTVQPPYNLAHRDIEDELVAACCNEEVAILPYQVLAGGVLTGTYDQKAPPPGDTHMASSLAGTARDRYWNPATFAVADRVSALAKDLGKSAAQVATAWALSKPGITSVIVGSSRPEQVHANVDALSIELDESAIAQLEASDS
jgi:aryl-alcohol dehydrogenase-like predicted oxidoreductase